MPPVRKVRALDYLSLEGIVVRLESTSFQSALLRLAEGLARRGAASRPLDLYGSIVNEAFVEVTRIGKDAAVFAVLTPAMKRLTLSIAVTDRALRLGDRTDLRVLILLAGRERDADPCLSLMEDLVDVLGPPERRAALTAAEDAREAYRVLKHGAKA
jgi:hypothetical protein